MPRKRPTKQTRPIPPNAEIDLGMMRRALTLARRGEGLVEPNPMVGCVLARNDRVIGEGYHRRFAHAHAEIDALASCQGSVRGVTAYVPLAPCCHHGKTPPCCDALIKAGVGRVVVGTLDPGPLGGASKDHISRTGVERLRAAGVAVEVGVCEEEARRLIAPFAARTCHGRPYVIAKWAQTLDGSLATASGDSKWISCEASRRQVHRLRARVDAIVVGVGTVLMDDPLLTARDVRVRRVASRVVLDGRLGTPLSSRLIRSIDTAPTVIMTTVARSKSAPARRLIRQGVEVVGCRVWRGVLDLADVLRRLAARDATNVLVEGGATVLTSLFARGLIDEAFVYIAPTLFNCGLGIGDCGLSSLGEPELRNSQSAIRNVKALRPTSTQWRRSGDDICAHLRFGR